MDIWLLPENLVYAAGFWVLALRWSAILTVASWLNYA